MSVDVLIQILSLKDTIKSNLQKQKQNVNMDPWYKMSRILVANSSINTPLSLGYHLGQHPTDVYFYKSTILVNK